MDLLAAAARLRRFTARPRASRMLLIEAFKKPEFHRRECIYIDYSFGILMLAIASGSVCVKREKVAYGETYLIVKNFCVTWYL